MQKPIIKSWNEINSSDGDILLKNETTIISILPKILDHRTLTNETSFKIYFSNSKLILKEKNGEKIKLDNGGFIGVPPFKDYLISSDDSNILCITYSLGELHKDEAHHYNKEVWGIDKDIALETLRMSHDMAERTGKKKTNGRKFISTSIYKTEESLQGSLFYLPNQSNEYKFPILTSHDIFFSIADKVDGQDYHSHKNTAEIILLEEPIQLIYKGIIWKRRKKNICGVLIIPAQIPHQVILNRKSVKPAFFIGIRETDAGTDKLIPMNFGISIIKKYIFRNIKSV